MATLTVQLVVDAGTKPTYTVANATDYAPIGSGTNTFLHVKNGDGANAKTVTLTPPGLSTYGETFKPHVVTIAANGEGWIPLRRAFQDDATAGLGNCAVAYAGTGGLGSVTAAVIQVA